MPRAQRSRSQKHKLHCVLNIGLSDNKPQKRQVFDVITWADQDGRESWCSITFFISLRFLLISWMFSRFVFVTYVLSFDSPTFILPCLSQSQVYGVSYLYSLRSRRFRLVSKQRKTVERNSRFWPRKKWNKSQKMKVGGGSFTYAIFARSLTIVPRSLLLNCTETLATQAIFIVFSH